MNRISGACLVLTSIVCVQVLFDQMSFDLKVFSQAVASESERKVIRLSEPVVSTSDYEEFGTPLQLSSDVVSLGELIEHSESYLDREVLVSTRVAQVCQKKGCFFIAREGDTMARVTFKDYDFFIPTDSADKQVILSGTFSRSQLSAEQADHYASDLGASGSETAIPHKFEYLIVADSIRVPRD